MKTLALAVLVLVLPQEKNEAEELFKRMEEKLSKAATLQVAFTCSFEQHNAKKDVSGKLAGSVLVEQGNKVRLETEGKIGTPISVCIVSDGKTTAFMKKDPVDPGPTPTVASLGRDAVLLVARTGGVSAVMEIQKGLFLNEFDRKTREEGRVPESRETDPLKTIKPGGFTSAPAEKIDGRDAKFVRYTVEEVGKIDKPTVTIWIDAATLLPIKRKIADESKGIVIEETYTDFKLDEKIDPAKFELPKESK